MRNSVFSLVLLAACGLAAAAQETSAPPAPAPTPSRLPKFLYEEECGSPLSESNIWMSVEGSVIEILDGDSVTIQPEDGKLKRVDLVAVDAPDDDPSARQALSDFVMGKSVSVTVQPGTEKRKRLVGVVRSGSKDVNRELIAAGVARYKKADAHTLSSYDGCVYQILEGVAREAKRGLWQNHDPR